MLVVGRNCWRVARADRAAFLIDADAYFTAFRQVVGQARERVIIMGWDVDSRVRLDARDPGSTLLSFLNQTLARRPGLSIHVLAWDFSVLFALEREPLPAFRFAWNADPRLRFQLDDAHPFSGSHHQKIVAVDGRVAFAGGLDLAIRRWDTPAHDAHDPRRVDPAGHPYPPTHDVQMIVEGEAAAALDELARARWRAATGQAVPAAAAGAPEVALWPEGLEPDVRDAPVGIARTAPAFRDAPPIGEVAMLTLDAIAAARRWLYIENQYLTSAAAGGGAGPPAGGARRPRDRHRAAARRARLAGAAIDGDYARARPAPAARQPTGTDASASSTRSSRTWTPRASTCTTR